MRERRLFALSMAGALGLHAALLGLFLLDPRPGGVREGAVRGIEALPVTVLLTKPGETARETSAAGLDRVPPPPELAMSSGGAPREQTPRREKRRDRNRIISEADRPHVLSRDEGTPLPFHQDLSHLRASDAPLPPAEAGDPISYERIILGRLAKAKRFPPGARSRGARGVAVVAFRLGETGDVAAVALLRSSGETDLDGESLALVARASPFPAPPAGAQRSFAVDIAFGMGR